MKRLWRAFVRYLFTLGGEQTPQERHIPAMSGASVQAGMVLDDVAHRFDKRRLAFEIRQTAGAERLMERGWDWDQTVPDGLFFGQTTHAGPAEAATRLTAAHDGLHRAADMFTPAVDGWSDTLT